MFNVFAGAQNAAAPSPEKPDVDPRDDAEGLVFEADYPENRPIALLAERRRKFHARIQGRFVNVDLLADE